MKNEVMSVCESDVLLMKKIMSDIKKMLILIFISFGFFVIGDSTNNNIIKKILN